MLTEIITKTIAQADEAADIQDDDWMLTQRGDAPATKVRVQAHREAVAEKIAEEFADTGLSQAFGARDEALAAALDASAAADAAVVAREVAELAILALPNGPSYDTDAAGLAATPTNGSQFWLRTLQGLALRTRLNAGAAQPYAIGTRPFVMPSRIGIAQMPRTVRCKWVAGATIANFDLQAIDPDFVFTGTGENYTLEFPAPYDASTGMNFRLLNGDGTLGIDLRNCRGPDGLNTALGSFKKFDWLRAVMNPGVLNGEPGLAANWRLVAAPTTAFTQATDLLQAILMQTPSPDYPVFVAKVTDRVWVIVQDSWQYDDAAMRMESDRVVTVLYDLARLMSLGTLKTAMALAINSQFAISNGRELRYAQFLSNEGNGGVFDREQHTVWGAVMKVGLFSDPGNHAAMGWAHGNVSNKAADVTLTMFNKTDFVGGVSEIHVGDVVTGLTSGATGKVHRVGPGAGKWTDGNRQGALILKDRTGTFTPGEQLRVGGVTRATCLTSGVLSLDLSAMAKGLIYNGTEILLQHRFDTWRPTPTRIGQVSIAQRFNPDGVRDRTVFEVGRGLSFNTGTSQPAIGATITGPNGSGVLVVLPALDATGSWGGGDRAGMMFLKDVVGTFAAGEDLQVGGVTFAKAAGAVAAKVGFSNSFQAILPTTTCTMFQTPGYPAINLADIDGVQRPDARDGQFGPAPAYAWSPPGSGLTNFAGTWPKPGGRVQAWHPRNAGAGTTAILELVLTQPFTPPGDYSWCDDSKMQVENRAGGLRKVSINATSGAARAFEGQFVVESLVRWRYGTPITA